VYYVHNDHLGTPQKLSNASGAVVWSAIYAPFGNTTVNEDVDNDGINVVFNLRFRGQYYDVETGLHYNYFRYYDPATGRYISSDPIGLQGGLNTYGYVGGNPTNRFDEKGLFWSCNTFTGVCVEYPDPGVPQNITDLTGKFDFSLSKKQWNYILDNLSKQSGVTSGACFATGNVYGGAVFGGISLTSGVFSNIIRPDPIGVTRDAGIDIITSPLPPHIEIFVNPIMKEYLESIDADRNLQCNVCE